jgi:hypothetical protein
MEVAKQRGHNHALLALTREFAVILHRTMGQRNDIPLDATERCHNHGRSRPHRTALGLSTRRIWSGLKRRRPGSNDCLR